MVIYKITNLINNKVYVGQTIQKNPKMRWYAHLADARNGKKTHLYDSIRKYGISAFLWEIIDTGTSLGDLNAKEEYWLEHFRSLTEVYNLRKAGDNKLHSAKSIIKMSESQKAAHARRRFLGIEGGWKRKDGGPMKGKVHPKKGKPSKKWSEEDKARHKIRMKEVMRKRFNKENI
jgi:group I intron endonuclease